MRVCVCVRVKHHDVIVFLLVLVPAVESHHREACWEEEEEEEEWHTLSFLVSLGLFLLLCIFLVYIPDFSLLTHSDAIWLKGVC